MCSLVLIKSIVSVHWHWGDTRVIKGLGKDRLASVCDVLRFPTYLNQKNCLATGHYRPPSPPPHHHRCRHIDSQAAQVEYTSICSNCVLLFDSRTWMCESGNHLRFCRFFTFHVNVLFANEIFGSLQSIKGNVIIVWLSAVEHVTRIARCGPWWAVEDFEKFHARPSNGNDIWIQFRLFAHHCGQFRQLLPLSQHNVQALGFGLGSTFTRTDCPSRGAETSGGIPWSRWDFSQRYCTFKRKTNPNCLI